MIIASPVGMGQTLAPATSTTSPQLPIFQLSPRSSIPAPLPTRLTPGVAPTVEPPPPLPAELPPSGMSRNTKIAIGAGIGAVGLIALFLLLR